MAVSAAHALCPTLKVIVRDTRQEQRALAQLATWATQFTSLVSVAPPQSVLLEVGRSAKLFGGLETLYRRVSAELSQLGYDSLLTLAPTPLAALFFARVGRVGEHSAADWQKQVQALPLGVLDVSADTLQDLQHLGLTSLGDCQRLPRADLAKRFGPALITQLDQALGALPDVREPYVLPEHFHGRIVLPAQISHHEPLLFPLRRLLLEFMAFLRSRQQGAQNLTVVLEHEGHAATEVHIALRQPSRQLSNWMMVLSERLARLPLPAGVCAVTVQAEQFSPLAPDAQALFGPEGETPEAGAVLIERLQARLGNGAVRGLRCVTEHRPEHAWCYGKMEESPSATHASVKRRRQRNTDTTAHSQNPVTDHGPDRHQRPLWLLPQPVLLKLVERRPWLDGPLVFVQGPERIESGWWDGADVARDYFIAHDATGRAVWIYRERSATPRWFLHGIFA